MGIKSYINRKNLEKFSKQKQSDNAFTAYIIKGNRQVIKYAVEASRKFVYGEGTYVVKQECIFYKLENGLLEAISVYAENNPNPYDFETLNKGLPKETLNAIFEGDFYTILVDAQRENKLLLLIITVFINLGLTLVFFITTLLGKV